jgi:hypothetical protein
MGWLGSSHGVFNLHDSDNYCGSFISVADAAEILGIQPKYFEVLKVRNVQGVPCVSERDLHVAWSFGRVCSPDNPPRVGNAARSLDEVILARIIALTYSDAVVVPQVPFSKRKRVDLKVVLGAVTKYIEFCGPGHFTGDKTPLARKSEVEAELKDECIIWPFWMQRCSRNVRAIFQTGVRGLAAVWSTKCMFGDFTHPDSAKMIVAFTERFGAIYEDGISYMYLSTRTNKPIHPILEKIRAGSEGKERLIPRGNSYAESFWVPLSYLTTQ